MAGSPRKPPPSRSQGKGGKPASSYQRGKASSGGGAASKARSKYESKPFRQSEGRPVTDPTDSWGTTQPRGATQLRGSSQPEGSSQFKGSDDRGTRQPIRGTKLSPGSRNQRNDRGSFSPGATAGNLRGRSGGGTRGQQGRRDEDRRAFVETAAAAREQIEGRHPVGEALRAGRFISVLYLQQDGENEIYRDLEKMAADRSISVHYLPRPEMDNLSEGRLHQGVIALAGAKPLCDLDDILAVAQARGEAPFIVVLDGLEDPQNVGSLIRSAEAAGCHGLIIRERRAAPVTPTLIKATAGAWEYLAVAQVVNIPRALEELKSAGLWIVGADMRGTSVYEADLNRPLALVIGSEGAGLSHLVRQRCDLLVSLPMRGSISSLGAAAAGGILLYEALRQRSS